MLRWIIKTPLFLSLMLVAPTVQAGESTDAWMQRMLDKTTRQTTASLPMTTPPSRLLSFVSFSMPDASLKAVLEQTAKAGGITVLRGLVNDSFKDTATKISTLAREQGPGFSVDPRKFAQYTVNVVPTFVVIGTDAFDKIVGNMSLDAALETIAREGHNREVTQSLLAKLRRTP